MEYSSLLILILDYHKLNKNKVSIKPTNLLSARLLCQWLSLTIKLLCMLHITVSPYKASIGSWQKSHGRIVKFPCDFNRQNWSNFFIFQIGMAGFKKIKKPWTGNPRLIVKCLSYFKNYLYNNTWLFSFWFFYLNLPNLITLTPKPLTLICEDENPCSFRKRLSLLTRRLLPTM